MKIERMRLGSKPDWEPVGESTMIAITRADGLRVSLSEMSREDTIRIQVEPGFGRLEVREFAVGDRQIWVEVARVDAPSGARIAELSQRLLEIEWGPGGEGSCPACGRTSSELHDGGCWLGAFLGQPSALFHHPDRPETDPR